jgi:hypothetical protein
MKVCGGVDVYLHAFLTLALDGGKWSASCLSLFTPKESAPCTLCIGGCVGPRAGLVMMMERKFSALAENESWLAACSLVTILSEVPWLLEELV